MAIRKLKSFFREELAQDIVEMALLLAFLGLTTGAVVVGVGTAVQTLFSIAGDRVEYAASGANGSESGGDTGGGTTGGTTNGNGKTK
jgi:Flp pilus assembly pilin Flp